jgi:hypothetical protein
MCRRPAGWAEELRSRVEAAEAKRRSEGVSQAEIEASRDHTEEEIDKDMLHTVRVLIRNAKWGHGKSKPQPKTFHAELAKQKSLRQKG